MSNKDLREIVIEGELYTRITSIGANGNIFDCTYSRSVVKQGHRMSISYRVERDVSELVAMIKDKTFDFGLPHRIGRVEKTDHDIMQNYYRNFDVVNQVITIPPPKGETEKNIKIINYPVEYTRTDGLIYRALASDERGNLFILYWNLLLFIEPSKIILVQDQTRYCKHCLTDYPSERPCVKEKHEWIENGSA